jgi:hypothetical protein
LQVCHLLFGSIRLLHDDLDPIEAGTLGDDRRHHRLLRHQAMRDMIPGLFPPPHLEPALVLGVRPIAADHFPPLPMMGPRHDLTGARHQALGIPAGLNHRFVHGPTATRRPRLPHLYIVYPR